MSSNIRIISHDIIPLAMKSWKITNIIYIVGFQGIYAIVTSIYLDLLAHNFVVDAVNKPADFPVTGTTVGKNVILQCSTKGGRTGLYAIQLQDDLELMELMSEIS
jgi:hypothetical protein